MDSPDRSSVLEQYLESLNTFERKNAPENLFWKGDFSLLTQGRRVSVVGSRKASEHGLRRARIVSEMLIENGITVVSGLAEGIDTIAHKTAIELGGRTITVLGTPLNKSFPASNKALQEEIAEHHLAISQFPEGYPTTKEAFPRRNRTMALISDATIIIEANPKSGTRHQGWEALRIGRMLYILENVLAMPGNTWANEMLQYGAISLGRDQLEEAIVSIPSFTSEAVLDF